MEPGNESLYALALNKIPGVGGVTYRRLVERFGSAGGVFRAGRKALETVKGIRKEALEAIVSSDAEKSGREEWEKISGAGFRVIFFKGTQYPPRLAEIHDPPPVLYVTGDIRESDEIAVAVVGSRDPTEYGRGAAEKIACDLARAGVTIVSGMARGIDSAAHRAAIEAGGRTIAVLGSGLDVIYPSENKKLFDAIREHGAVISPYPIGAKPEKGNFPARNRIISGISLGVIIVQATTPDSGSLITARHALEQGREVFAVPGRVGSQTSRGTNRLIKKGEAKLIETAADVLEEILPQLKTPERPAGSDLKTAANKPLSNLSKSERTVYNCTGDEPMHIDIIARKCNIPIHELAGTLLSLELKGLVTQQPGAVFARKSWPGGN